MTDQTSLVRAHMLATAIDRCEQVIPMQVLKGSLPRPDAVIRDTRGGVPARAWSLSALRAWNPRVADRCAAMMAAIENLPLDA